MSLIETNRGLKQITLTQVMDGHAIRFLSKNEETGEMELKFTVIINDGPDWTAFREMIYSPTSNEIEEMNEKEYPFTNF